MTNFKVIRKWAEAKGYEIQESSFSHRTEIAVITPIGKYQFEQKESSVYRSVRGKQEGFAKGLYWIEPKSRYAFQIASQKYAIEKIEEEIAQHEAVEETSLIAEPKELPSEAKVPFTLKRCWECGKVKPQAQMIESEGRYNCGCGTVDQVYQVVKNQEVFEVKVVLNLHFDSDEDFDYTGCHNVTIYIEVEKNRQYKTFKIDLEGRTVEDCKAVAKSVHEQVKQFYKEAIYKELEYSREG